MIRINGVEADTLNVYVHRWLLVYEIIRYY